MIIRKTFEEWLQKFNSGLNIQEIENPDVDVLYFWENRLCSIPKGLKNHNSWTDLLNDKRVSDYITSDGIMHRSLSGVGLVLMKHNIINMEQFLTHFTSDTTKEEFIKKMVGRYGNVQILKD